MWHVLNGCRWYIITHLATHQVQTGVPGSRLEEREAMGVPDIPAAKIALSATIDGFAATVRPPLMPASREQQQQLRDIMEQLGCSTKT